MHIEILSKAIADRGARVCVVGQGYVGLPLALAIARAGFHTTGLDIDPGKITRLGRGLSHVSDISDAAVAEALAAGRYQPTTDYDVLRATDVAIITVPTPLSKTKEPDVSHIIAALEGVKPHLHPGMLLVLESTTYPGTTDEIIASAVMAEGLTPGVDVLICFSPERTDPGNVAYGVENTPKVIGGITDICTDVGRRFYATFVQDVVPVSSARVAEMTKLLENTFRAVNIALVNELALMSDRMGIDIWEVINAAATKPYGFMPFYPGPGIGGHCIPLDPMYLAWKARSYNFYTKFIELASEINGNMPRYVVSRVAHALNLSGKAISAARILLLGVSYKPQIGDIRESPGLEILWLLHEAGADTDYSDPYVAELKHDGLELESVAISAESVAEYDCVVLATSHRDFDYELIAKNARRILDTRNAFSGFEGDHIVRLGNPSGELPRSRTDRELPLAGPSSISYS